MRDLWRKLLCDAFHRRYHRWRLIMPSKGCWLKLAYDCDLCARHWERREAL